MVLARTLSGQVSVTTAEGDRVTLSAAWSESFQGAIYDGVVRRDDVAARFQQALAGSESRNDLGFVVEGQLNEQEAQDLTALFRAVGSIFDKFYRGESDEGVTRAVGLAETFGEWEALASLDLDLHVQRSVTVATAGQSVIDSAAPSGLLDTPGVAPQAGTAIPSSSLGTTAPTQLLTSGIGEQSVVLAERLLDILDAARLRRHRLRDFLAQLLERADRRAKEHTEPDDERAAIAAQARDLVLERMNEPVAPPRAVIMAFSYSHTAVNHSRYAAQA